MQIQGIHFITENTAEYSHAQLANLALRAGIKVIQYRNKHAGIRAMLEEAAQIQRLCHEHGALLVINDHLDLALGVGATGLHLGQGDMPVDIARRLMGPKAVIGASVRTLEQAALAKAQGASYLGYGPIFTTVSKADAGGQKGLGGLSGFSGRAGLPVVALGGVNEENIALVKQAGANGVAMISAISHALDPEQAAIRLKQKWESA